MNEPGTDLQNSSRPVDAEESVETLRRQVNLLFGGFLISSITLTAFLGLQARRASAELMEARAVATQQYTINKQDVASIEVIYSKLAEFGRTHPDFQKRILSRYQFDASIPPTAVPKK